MLEALARPDTISRLRSATVAPAVALGVWIAYLGLIPLVSSVPRILFEAIRLVLFAGVGVGFEGGLRALKAEKSGGTARLALMALLWAAALLMNLWLLLEVSIPWLL